MAEKDTRVTRSNIAKLKFVFWLLTLSSLVALAAGLVIVLPNLLVLDNRTLSDYIVVLDGHDGAYYAGLNLLQRGMGRRMFLCPDLPSVPLNGEELRKDREFVEQTAGDWTRSIEFCSNDDVEDVLAELARDLERSDAHSALIVTPEAESRMQYILASRQLPQFSWSVAAVPDETRFSVRWWRKWIWVKTYFHSLHDLAVALREPSQARSSVQRSSK